MPETKKSYSDLISTIFQDGQPDNSITAGDMRDFIASMMMPFGSAYMEDNATATTINTIDVFEVIAGTFTAGSNLEDFTVSAAGVLTYTGDPDRLIPLVASVGLVSAADNKVFEFQWFKNGTTAIAPKQARKHPTAADVGHISVRADVLLSTDDTVQLKVANATDTANVTVQNVYLLAQGCFC